MTPNSGPPRFSRLALDYIEAGTRRAASRHLTNWNKYEGDLITMAKAKTIIMQMYRARETKGTFRYETQPEEGSGERPQTLYLPKTMLTAELGGAPENITIEISPSQS